MMSLSLEKVRLLTSKPSSLAWVEIIRQVVDICSQALDYDKVVGEIGQRDRDIGTIDDFLATSAWDLWESFSDDVPRNAVFLSNWWNQTSELKAILILDGLSLRELPWLIDGASQHNLKIKNVSAYGAECPSETTAFAKAIGFSSRSMLTNNGGRGNKIFANVRTESTNHDWKTSKKYIDQGSNWVFWHHWPDTELHEEAKAGQGLSSLTRKVKAELTSDSFWNFVKALQRERALLITSDHGYAVTTFFSELTGKDEKIARNLLKSKRFAEISSEAEVAIPSVVTRKKNSDREYLIATGRRKWKSPGGYPVLVHGGLSLFEMLCPLIEIERK